MASFRLMDGCAEQDLIEQLGLPPGTGFGPDLGTPGRTRVHLVGGDRFLKVFLGRSGRKPAREQAALEVLASSSLPVPRLVGHGDLADGSPWVLVSRLPGTPMGQLPAARDAVESERLDWARWAGRSAGELHLTRVPAFGPWTADPVVDPVDYYRSRSSILLSEAMAVGRLDRALLDRIGAAQREVEPSLRSIGDAVLVHRDLNAHNILGTRQPGGSWERTGVIDFESSGGGDPLEEMRWLAVTLPLGATQEAFVDGYRATGSAVPDDPDRVRYHQLDLILDIGTWQMDDPSLLVRAGQAARRLT